MKMVNLTPRPLVFVLIFPKRFLSSSSSLSTHLWFVKWLFYHYLFISPSFVASERLCFVIVTFLEYFTYIFVYCRSVFVCFPLGVIGRL